MAGTLLRQARKRAGLSQVGLATRAAVAQSVISAYESGQRQPSLPALTRLVDAAGFELTPGIASGATCPAGTVGPRAEGRGPRAEGCGPRVAAGAVDFGRGFGPRA